MISTIFRAERLRLLGSVNHWLTALLFFVLALVCYSLMLSNSPKALSQSSGAAVWVAAIFSILLSTNRLFDRDHQQGLIDQLRVAQVSLTGWVMIRLGLHWMVSGFCLVILSPIAGVFMGLSVNQTLWLATSLLLGTPVIGLFAALAESLSLSAQQSAAFAPLIALPLCLPVLLFSAGMLDQVGTNAARQPLLLLLALLIVSISTLPWTIAATLKLSES